MEKNPLRYLPRNHFGAILVDAPSEFLTWSSRGKGRSAERHYDTMSFSDLADMPVKTVAAKDCALFAWVTWPTLPQALDLISMWGFTYKTCAFSWMKADNTQIDLLDPGMPADMKMGYWTRSNSEACLLATRGKPKRLHADVRQGIIEPARQHSRKPDCVHGRIEKLVAGPYLELFARTPREGWTSWGNEIGKFQKGGLDVSGRNAVLDVSLHR